MSCEDCGDIYPSLLAKRNSYSGQPLVELDDDGTLLFVIDILEQC